MSLSRKYVPISPRTSDAQNGREEHIALAYLAQGVIYGPAPSRNVAA